MDRSRARFAALVLALTVPFGAAYAQTPPPPPLPLPDTKDVPYAPLVDEGPLRKPIVWTGRRFSTIDWITVAAGAAVTISSVIISPRETHWSGGRLFDEDARNLLRLGTATGRFVARDASDVILSLETTWPFFIDAIVGAWWYHGSPDAAIQMTLIDAKALSLVTALHGAATLIAGRERPYGRNCGAEFLPSESGDCEGSRRYRSFFSGHASSSFLGASLICVHHLKLNLLGSRTASIVTCAVAYSGAAATALLRTLGDVHYTTDILVGALVGTAIGIGVPLWHYRKPSSARSRAGDLTDGVDVQLMPFGAGLAIGGTF